MSRVGLNAINAFVRHDLKRKLRDDLRCHRILREGDIECCAYFHLRRFLSSDSDWRVFAHHYNTRTSFYPDLIVFNPKCNAAFPIEIKWNRTKISGRDRKKLGKYLGLAATKKRLVRRAYFVTAGPDVDKYEKTDCKDGREKCRLFEVRAGLKFKASRRRFADWKEERKRFTVWRHC